MKYLLISCFLLTILASTLEAQVQLIPIKPGETDAAITSIHGDHLALIDTKIKPLNKLLLMIVGTGASSHENLPFDSFAATLGYHVISLDYNNNVITTACSNSEDSACFNKFRQEIVFGQPVSELVAVDSANSIYHRFYELLVYMSKKYPQQNWQQYLRGNTVQWQQVTVAGHSQGAGHAAYFGKNFPLDRVLIFAGPQDYLVHFSMPAGWLSYKSSTPTSKYFAFLHLKDPFDFNKQLAGCMKLMRHTKAATLLVQPGAAVSSNSHLLVTNIETANPHGSMLQLQFVKAWLYLLSPVAGSAKK